MHFIFNQMMQLENGHHADGYRLVIRQPGFAISQDLFPQRRHRNAVLAIKVCAVSFSFSSLILSGECQGFPSTSVSTR